MKRLAALLLALLALLVPASALAQQKKGKKEAQLRTCDPHLPAGVPPPVMREELPSKGMAGYATIFTVEIDLQPGDTIVVDGLGGGPTTAGGRALRQKHFAVPEPDAGAPIEIDTSQEGKAILKIPVVPLPDKPGRIELQLPPLPIGIQRGSGSILTVCTSPHTMTVEDPTSNETNPKVKPSPDGRPQREEWTMLKHVLVALLIAFFVLSVTALVVAIWFRRPELEEYQARVPPWIVAIEELAVLERSDLLDRAPDQHFDAVTDAVRKYLGARYGFDGLEATTDEIRARLRRIRPSVPGLKEIGRMLEESDLVKFARVEPVREDCVELMTRCQQIVRGTIPPEEIQHIDQDRRVYREELAREEKRRKVKKRAPVATPKEARA